MFGSVGHFGDVRREARGKEIMSRIVASKSLVQRKVGETRAGEIAMDRFLSQAAVTKEEIVETVSQRTAQRCKGRRVLVAQDTTEINFSGREEGRIGLGPAGDGKSAGFFIHAAVAVDIEDEAVVGLAAAQIWTRPRKRRTKDKDRPFAKRESARWLTTTQEIGERFAEASQLIVVSDREGDIYEYFARRPAGVELIVRAAQNRALQEGGLLFDEPAEWPVLARATISVPGKRTGEKPRTARVEYRAGVVRLRRPRTADATLPKHIELSFVDVREIGAPKGATVVHWRLFSTLPANDAAQAIEIVQLYRLRWRIEQVFRGLKSDGLGLEEVQMQKADKLLKLAALGIEAAVRILQLVDARDGGPRPATDVLDEAGIAAARLIGPTLEGKTARQRNPHPPGSLAWLAWMVARLGGWNCYYKPPGPKTMTAGWRSLSQQIRGILIVTRHTRICTQDV